MVHQAPLEGTTLMGAHMSAFELTNRVGELMELLAFCLHE